MSSESPTVKTRPPIWPWLLAAGLVLLLLPLVMFVSFSSQATSQVEAEVARIRAAGEPATPAELEAFYARPPADKDVTQLWLAATAPLETPGFAAASLPLPIVGNGEAEIPPPGQPWPQLEAVEKLLSQYQPSLDQLHEAADRGGAARYPTSFSAGFSMLLTHVQGVRSGARMLALEAQVRAHRGDPAGAAQSIHAIFRLAGSLEQEPVLISQLVRMACDGVAREQIRRLLPALEFSPQDLALWQADLRGVQYAAGIERALLGERVLGAQAFQNPATLCGNDPGVLWRLTRRVDYAYYHQILGRMIAASRQPWPLARQQLQQIDDELGAVQGGSLLTRWQHPMTALTLPSIGNSLDAAAHWDGGNSAADAAIAIELYRRQHGDAPQRLDQLVPDFLPRVPLDPFDGQPLRYVIREKEYVVYSIGPNGTDEGGQEQDRGNPDVVFSVRLP